MQPDRDDGDLALTRAAERQGRYVKDLGNTEAINDAIAGQPADHAFTEAAAAALSDTYR